MSPCVSACTVDPHLSGLIVSGRSDYPEWMMTVQLECIVGSVRFIRVFECGSVHKCMGFNSLQLSEHTQVPMSSDEQGSTVHTNNSVAKQNNYRLLYTSLQVCTTIGVIFW